jgi:hypothetical protein
MTDDPAASAVLEAFEAAQAARLPPVDCYRAGVEAWRRAHPAHGRTRLKGPITRR